MGSRLSEYAVGLPPNPPSPPCGARGARRFQVHSELEARGELGACPTALAMAPCPVVDSDGRSRCTRTAPGQEFTKGGKVGDDDELAKPRLRASS